MPKIYHYLLVEITVANFCKLNYETKNLLFLVGNRRQTQKDIFYPAAKWGCFHMEILLIRSRVDVGLVLMWGRMIMGFCKYGS